MNQHVGRTVRSPEGVPEYRQWLDNAIERDGLDPAKKPDMLVQGEAGFRLWDTRTMKGGTADVESALKTITDKVTARQSVRIAINLDFVNNDGAAFARELGSRIRAGQRAPATAIGVKEVVVIKGGSVYRAYP